VQYYVDGLASSPEALHGSFQLYRAFGATAAQNQQRKTRRLPMPVLAMGGAESSGAMPADTMKLTADDVQTLVIPGISRAGSRRAGGGADRVPRSVPRTPDIGRKITQCRDGA